MRISWCGIGKLGFPLAIALGQKHAIRGYDLNPHWHTAWKTRHKELGPTLEDDFASYVDTANIGVCSCIEDSIKGCDFIFCCAQTPHEWKYGGTERLPDERKDFDYKALIACVTEITKHTTPDQTLVVVSTVLPGTMRREILPLTTGKCKLVYSPQFAAMGSVCRDFLDPEFVLLGGEDVSAVSAFWEDFYKTQGQALFVPPLIHTSYENAELIKVAYNLIVSKKVGIANTLQQICHCIPGCDIDTVMDVLCKAKKRLISPAYLQGGMEDGGACVEGCSLISTTEGLIPIRNLVGREDVLVKVQSRENRGEIIKLPARNIRKTREGQSLIRVTLENGYHIDCTPDHTLDASSWNLDSSGLRFQIQRTTIPLARLSASTSQEDSKFHEEASRV